MSIFETLRLEDADKSGSIRIFKTYQSQRREFYDEQDRLLRVENRYLTPTGWSRWKLETGEEKHDIVTAGSGADQQPRRSRYR